MQRTKWHSRKGAVQSMLTAIWALVIFTGILAAATGFHTYTTCNLDKSPEEQTKAAGKLPEAILRIRSIEEHLQVAGEDGRKRRKEVTP